MRRVGVLGQPHVLLRFAQALDIGAARGDRVVVVGRSVKKADRVIAHLLVLPVACAAGRVEGEVGGELEAGWRIALLEAPHARVQRWLGPASNYKYRGTLKDWKAGAPAELRAFLPATREVRIVSRALCGDNLSLCSPANSPQANPLAANGLIAGQYHAPNFEFIFPENLLLGDAVVSANFQDLPFLFCGAGPLSTPTAGGDAPLVRQLDPAPWAAPMPTPTFAATLCSGEPTVGALAVTVPNRPPVIKVFPADTLTVNSGAAVFLSAAATDATGLPVAVTWVHSGGSPLPAPPMVPPGQPNAITFNAPVGPTDLVFTVMATNPATGLSSTATVKLAVTGRASDTVQINNAAWTSSRQNRGALTVVATTDAPVDANGQPPADLQLFVQASAMVATLVPDGSGFLNFVTSAVQLSSTPLSMFYGDTGNPQVCPAGAARCWQFVTRGALIDPNAAGVFIPPDSITVTSSYGGSATATGGSITLR